ncbi:MAG: restriction endonuclease [Limisphaerales bacterium]
MHPFSCTVKVGEKSRVLTGTDLAVLTKQSEALGRTWQAEAALEEVQNILHEALQKKHAINWDQQKIKYNNPYPKPKPNELSSGEPQPTNSKYKPELLIFDRLIKSRAEQKIQAAHNLYLQEHAAWEKARQQNLADIEEWSAAVIKFKQQQESDIAATDKQKADYESLQPNAITAYCKLVLAASKYPDNFPKEFDLQYIPSTKILVVDYGLPAPEKPPSVKALSREASIWSPNKVGVGTAEFTLTGLASEKLPNVKEVKYIKAKDEFREVLLSETESNRLYDDALYQICLRTIHELFDADAVGALGAVVFNGWVRSIDKATGKEVNACVISVQAKKEEFREINLNQVEAKSCFKALKGVGSSQLHSLTPVAPVLNISREDKRFIASKEVAGQLDERFNLAAMAWEDFEQLIRELFEQEFNKNGGEVKVTQASRDGGVDAVAFDPDPIHGGKIVIQAKRYTNTVGVAAVRELYGTVLNEGAMKGILITTADYGPDAYEFAKGKPLTLMNGANLLYLLEKHGHKAKIDIAEAKKILGEKPF